jgi:ABC-type nitrate/sulfonate/bicarbonate transport system ATPase subunit
MEVAKDQAPCATGSLERVSVDRILVMTQRPATIQEIVDVDLARRRDLDSRSYLEKRDRIFRLMGMSLRVGEATAA